MKPRDVLSLAIRIIGLYWLVMGLSFFVGSIAYSARFNDDHIPWANGLYQGAMLLIAIFEIRFASSISKFVWRNPPDEPLTLGTPSSGWYAFAFGTFGAVFTVSQISRFGSGMAMGLSLEPRFNVLPYTPTYFVWNIGVNAVMIALGLVILFRAPSLGNWLYAKHRMECGTTPASTAS